MRRGILALGCALLLVALGAGVAVAAARPSLLGLESQFMCVSCHEPLELVSSPQAQQEKQFIAGLLAKGDSAAQIRSVMVANYGVAVLGRPPASGFNLTVYILPPAILLIGAAGLLYTLPKWRARARRAAATAPSTAQPLQPADAARLDDELARFI